MPPTLNQLLGNLFKKYNTLLDCPIRFTGHYGDENVHKFIDYVDTYKEVKCIPDEQALQELSHLLTENAHSWWLKKGCHFSKWSEAKTALTTRYASQRPAHLIYKDIFSHAFNEYSSEEDFIDDKLELLNELPEPKPNEKSKLDMIFALLPCENQSKVDFSRITSVLELKNQFKKLNSKTNNNGEATDSSQNQDIQKNCNENKEVAQTTQQQKKTVINGNDLLELQRNIQLKETLNGLVRIGTENNCAEVPTKIVIVNDKEPVIKVRRTEDLMPQIKEEESVQNTLNDEQEFISTETNNNNSNENINSFQIDTDIMNQINNIIDESEMHCDVGRDSRQISSIMGPKDSSPTVISFLINDQTKTKDSSDSNNNSNNNAHKNNSNNNNGNNKLVKKRIRCSYCRKGNHISVACLKKFRDKRVNPEKVDKFERNNNIKSVKATDPDVSVTSSTVNCKKNNDDSNYTALSPDTTVSPILNNISPSETITLPTTAAMLISPNVPLPYVPPPFSHISTPSPVLSHAGATMTTKLIAPINGPSLNKQFANKLRNAISVPKCHQCGNLGFYKSICPNCSPIYNSSQYKP